MNSHPVIDSHHHLWHYSPAEYGWIDDTMAVLRRDFSPSDLVAEMANAKVDGAIAVQARQTIEETHWLLKLAEGCPQIRGVVGWAPIASPTFEASLPQLASQPKLVGLRHVVQAEPAGFLDAPDFNRGLRALTHTNLIYDILIFERQLEESTRFVDRHPQQSFVIDHIAKPKIATAELEPWRTQLRELSKRPNVSCKISGMVTEDSWSTWSIKSLRPYLDTVVESFGPDRLLVGSDWPVCLVATSYTRWWQTLRDYFANFNVEDRTNIFAANALRIYGLK